MQSTMQSINTNELSINASGNVTLKAVSFSKYHLTLSGGATFEITKEELQLMPALYEHKRAFISLHASVTLDGAAWKAISKAAFEYVLANVRAQLDAMEQAAKSKVKKAQAKVDKVKNKAIEASEELKLVAQTAELHMRDAVENALVEIAHASAMVGNEALKLVAIAELNIRWARCELRALGEFLKVEINFAIEQLKQIINEIKFLCAMRLLDAKEWLSALAEAAKSICHEFWGHLKSIAQQQKEHIKESILNWAEKVYLETLVPLLSYQVVCRISVLNKDVHTICMPIMWKNVTFTPESLQRCSAEGIIEWEHIHNYVKTIGFSCSGKIYSEKQQLEVKRSAQFLIATLAKRSTDESFHLRPTFIDFDSIEVDPSWSEDLCTLKHTVVRPRNVINADQGRVACVPNLALDEGELAQSRPFVHPGLIAVSVNVKYTAKTVVYRKNSAPEHISAEKLDFELKERYLVACTTIQKNGWLKECPDVKFVHFYFQEQKSKKTFLVACSVHNGKLQF